MQRAWKWGPIEGGGGAERSPREQLLRTTVNIEAMANQKRLWYQIHSKAQELKRRYEAAARGLVCCLLWNIIAVTSAWIKGEGVKIWLLAIIYFISGVPGAYVLRYHPLYNAIRIDSALKFGLFFLLYLLHILFCVFSAVAPPTVFEGMSFAGIFPAIDLFSVNALVGIFYFVGFGLFCLESLLSFWVIGYPASVHVLPRKWEGCN